MIASSGSVYGTAWSPFPSHPRYVPVDEDHPLDNADPYGLSKEVDERTAEMFTRRYQMSVAALRFHWITERDEQRQAVEEQRRGAADHVALARGLWGTSTSETRPGRAGWPSRPRPDGRTGSRR